MQFKPYHNWMSEEESEGLSGAWKHKCKSVLSSWTMGLLANCSVSFSWQAFSQMTDENMKLKFFMTDSCAEWRGWGPGWGEARLGVRVAYIKTWLVPCRVALCDQHITDFSLRLYQQNLVKDWWGFFCSFSFRSTFFFHHSKWMQSFKGQGWQIKFNMQAWKTFPGCFSIRSFHPS